MATNVTVAEIVEIAKAAELGAPIDWSFLENIRDSAYQVIASQVLEQFGDVEIHQSQALILLASLVQSQVENMVLNIKLNNQ